jgi:hypothetical protein
LLLFFCSTLVSNYAFAKNEKALVNSILFTKISYVFFAVFVFSKITSLGDSNRYLASSLYIKINSTALMDFSGFFAGQLPIPFSHFPAMLLSFFGIKYLIETLSKFNLCNTYKDRFFLFLLLSMPSVGVWSSIHSKESVGVFFMSIITAFIIKVNLQKILLPNKLELMAIILCGLFKPQYLISIINIYLFLVISRKFNIKSIGQLSLVLLAITIQIYILYRFQPIIDLLSFQMFNHFDSDTALSTRDNLFFENGDFYKHAPYGMFIGFFGPTFQEALTSPSKLLAFIESSILVLIIFTYISSSMRRMFSLKFNVSVFTLLLLTFFWILFVHYPFGVFNPGAAIRYRTNFIPLFIGMVLMTSNYHKFNYRIIKQIKI